MFRWTRITGLSIAIGAAICSFQLAQAAEHSVQARSGQPTHIWNFYNCQTHNRTGDGGSFVEHGTVSVRDVTQNRCGNANEPAREVWYTSAPGFKGMDKVTFPIGQGQIVFHVTVQ